MLKGADDGSGEWHDDYGANDNNERGFETPLVW
jgi:hypothetical protein